MTTGLKNTRMVLANGDPIEDIKFGKSSQRALDERTGEFNANDKNELVRSISNLMDAAASGQVKQETQSDNSGDAFNGADESEARREILASALNDPTGEEWAALGSGLARQINEQTDREGFLRRVSQGQTLKQGEIPRVPMPAHDTIAIVATSSAATGYQTIRQRVFTPEEFEIQANVRVENLDIEQVNGDLLEHAYNNALEGMMVQEDRLWKESADKTVGVVNDLEYIAGELTTKNLGNLRQAVAKWNLPASTAIISNDYWADIIGSNDFATFLDPITKYDLAMNGQIGTLVGMNLITDAFRQPNQKVLDPGEIYVVASPENHAAYSTRGGIRSTPTSGANSGNSTRGWFMTEPFSYVLANARSVSKGKRV